ncbi:MAG TPA: CdaR family protein [candidate division Zixibacteria bacterium]|nr:CdaR family protein [candidate division Zixibacteria bacterium]
MNTARGLLTNITTLLLAVILAIVIWAAAIRAGDPVDTRILEISVETIGVPPQATLLSRPPQSIFITIEGPASALENISPSDFEATVDLSEVPYSEVEVPIQVVFLGDEDQVQIISQSPETAVIRMEQIITRDIPISVHVRGDVARGHRQGDVRVEPDFVQVTGPEPRVNDLAEGRVTIFLDDAREDITEERSPTFYDNEGNVASVVGMTISPEEVVVIIPIDELAGFAEKPITVDWVGEPAPGYRLLDVKAEPTSVQVTGSPAELIGLRIQTEPVDISGLDESTTFQVALDLPDGVGVVDVQPIVVTVEIEPILTSDVVRRPVEIRALGEGFEAVVEPDQVRVFLFGPLPVLDSLAEDDIRVTVNLLNLVTGTHVLEPLVRVSAEEIEVRSTQPAVVTVIITSIISPTEGITGTETLTETENAESTALIGTVDGSYVSAFTTDPPVAIGLSRRFFITFHLPALG